MQTEQESSVRKGMAACIVKRIVAIIIVIAMIMGISRALRYVLIDDVSSYTRLTMHEFYEQDNMDVLFVGASHTLRSFSPAVLDEKLGLDTFNVGSPRQPLDVSYTLIQEAVEKYDIDQVYLELSTTIAYITKMRREDELTGVFIISDYLRPSLRKFKLLAEGLAPDYYANGFLLARRNWDKLSDGEYIADILAGKSTDIYKNYEYIDDYLGKGYVPDQNVLAEEAFITTKGYGKINTSKVTEDWTEILLQIIEYCKAHDVELTLMATPVPTLRLAGNENYDEYIEKVNEIIDGTGIKYYDFNLCREEYLPDTPAVYYDDSHLNTQGAEIFSNLVGDLMTGRITEEELFYGSCAEKLASLEPKVYGLSYKDIRNSETNEKIRRVKVVSNRYEGMEFWIQITPEGGETYTVREFSTKQYFEISPDEHGVCTVIWRMIDKPEDVREVNIAF